MTETREVPGVPDDLDVRDLFTLAAKTFRAIKRKMLSRIREEKEPFDPLEEVANMYELARTLQSVFATMGDRGPFARAGALLLAIENGNMERAAHGNGEHYPPSRDGAIQYLRRENVAELERWRRLQDEARGKCGIAVPDVLLQYVDDGLGRRDPQQHEPSGGARAVPGGALMRYREIRRGSYGVTIVVAGAYVWIAASIGGKVKSALGMRHGRLLEPFSHRPVEDSPERWRPAFWRVRTKAPPFYGDYIHNWWDWLGHIVNQVQLGYLRSGTSLKYPDHDEHSPEFKARLLAEEIGKHLDATYRNG